MSPALVCLLLLLASYLVGAIPFGWLIARMKGVDLFRVGSGNIGATNVGRTLGAKYGVLVFIFDFLKGALPVAAVVPLAEAVQPEAANAFGSHDILRAGAAALAFLGHLFPITLGFRGGKGVATGAGVVFVLVPIPTLWAFFAWIATVLLTRYVSLASIIAAFALLAVRLTIANPFGSDEYIITGFCLVGVALVVVKHVKNIRRLLDGTENQLGDRPMRHFLLRMLHIMSLGVWFGGAGFFTFTAPTIFDSLESVVRDGPSDRTAYQTIIAPGTDGKPLARALAGAAVGPIFPKYFLMQTICGSIALITAFAWWKCPGRIHRVRVVIVGFAFVLALAGSAISERVSELRKLRFDPNIETATAAEQAFTQWHLVSLGLSLLTIASAGVALAMAAKLPGVERGTS